MLSKIRDIRFKLRSNKLLHSLSLQLPQMLERCDELVLIAPASKWKIQKIFPTLSDMNVMIIGPDNESASAILYLPETDRGIIDFNRRKDVWAVLLKDQRLADWGYAFPRLLGEGQFKNRPYWIVEYLPGVGLDTMLHGDKSSSIMRHAVEAIGSFHKKTSKEIVVGDELLDKWIFIPINIILRSPLRFYHKGSRQILNRLGLELASTLRGKRVVISWIHGDYWPNNILVSEDGTQITGIVDWDLAQPDDLPSMDVVNFLLSAYREIWGMELGSVIVKNYESDAWESNVQGIWDQEIQWLNNTVPNLKNTLTIFWLRHLSANLLKSRRYSLNPVWAIRNFYIVMKYIEKKY